MATTQEHFAELVRHHARAAISGVIPKFLVPEALAETETLAARLGKTSLRTGRYIAKGSADKAPYLGFNELYSMRLTRRADYGHQ